MPDRAVHAPASVTWLSKPVLACDAATRNWDALASHEELPFPVHLWVAGPTAFGGTVTDWDGPDGIRDMQKRLPSVNVREFVEGGHSIHNTATGKFMEALLAVIDDAAKAANERPWPAAARSSWNPFRRWRS